MPAGSSTTLDDQDVVIVQTKRGRLGMSLMGQVLFSRDLILRTSKPRSLRSVALCRATDDLLQPLLEQHHGCEVVIYPPLAQSDAQPVVAPDVLQPASPASARG